MPAVTALKPVAAQVQDAAARVWPESSKIWPGTVLKDRRVILGDGTRARMVTVDGVTDLSPAELRKRKIDIPRGGSSYALWDGHPAVVLNVADPSYRTDSATSGMPLAATLFAAATDELFHATQQKWRAWKKGGGELRGTDFPLAVTPRLYRAMAYNDLVAAYTTPQQRSRRLAGAAYWWSRWQKEFPDEVKRAAVSDIGDGAAGYFGAVAMAMAMGAKRGDLAAIRKYTQLKPLDGTVDPGQVTLDGESTALGGVAGLLLDETRKDWKRQVTQGRRTPVDLLLTGVTPAAEPASDTLRQAIQNILSKLNTDLIPRVTPLVAAYRDTSHALVLVPMNTAEGDLDAGGYYVSREVPYEILARLNGTFRLPSGTLQAKEASVFVGTVGGRAYLIIPLGDAGTKGRESSNRVEFGGGTLTGSFQVSPRHADGREQLVAR
ncbi:hypothetical protein [Actinoallomurus soli]|uniref:hypothetical protein n=1 Tax=Actinoallomurus soli TaxID=2952535 RepID=UPI002091E627|nr:hypothetical protein [Actinoallomurus soli]MCO5969597.1 hypothetical protein [Actinoallomurus soli]